MPSPSRTPKRTRLCRGCAQAQDLINRLAEQLEHETPPTPDEVIANLPLLLESVLADLLAEYDLKANPDTRTARAIGMLTLGAESAQLLFEARSVAPSI